MLTFNKIQLSASTAKKLFGKPDFSSVICLTQNSAEWTLESLKTEDNITFLYENTREDKCRII